MACFVSPTTKRLPPGSQGVLDQREEVVPLQGGGVLELVHEEVPDALTDAEVDVGNDLRGDVAGKRPVQVIDEDGAM